MAQSDSAYGHIVSFGMNHPISTGSVNNELQIVKALLSELNSGATDATDLYIAYTNTPIVGNNPSADYYFASEFDTDNTQLILNNNENHRSMALTTSYESNADTTTNGSQNDKVIISSTVDANVTSEVLDDSSAYANATAKITLSDPYYTNSSPLAFTDGASTYNGYFDKTNISKFLTTRNVNSNSAHSNGQGTITAQEYASWNTRDSNYGCFLVNGTVSTDSTTGAPSATDYISSDPANILNPSMDYSISINPVSANDDPIFGRYQLSYVNQNLVDVSYNDAIYDEYGIIFNGNLKYVSDTAYSSFTTNVNASITENYLPTTLTVSELESWLIETTGVYADGFFFEVEGNSFNASLVGTNSNADNFPVDFDLTSMNFDAKNMYILEQSMTTDASNGSAALLPSLSVQSATYNNVFTITNGSLALQQTSDVSYGYIELVDGYENLDVNNYNTNGLISVYNSSKLSVEGDNTNFPRATYTSGSTGTGDILDNFVVQYAGDSSLETSVGVLSGDDLLADISYNVSCLVAQTTTNDSLSSWNNFIAYNNSAVAVVKDTNSTITPSAITFYDNSNNYTNNTVLTVIDIACNKKWSESKIYDENDAQISGIVADIVTTNSDVSFNLKDIRLKLTAKTLSDLSLTPTNSWVLSCPDSNLTSSTGKMGFIGDSAIVDYLLGEVGDTSLLSNTLSVRFEPTSTSIQANKFTKFRTQIVTSYDVSGVSYTQTTYDDEFDATISAPSYNADVLIDTTNYTKPANTKLYKRSYSQTVSVKIPLRFGNYNNIFITTPTVTQTVEYYVLTDDTNNNAELPRFSLKDVRDASGAILNAIFTMSTSNTVITFSKNTFKTHKYSLEKKTNTSWDNVSLEGVVYHADLWYNTQTTIPSSIGTFAVSQTISPSVSTISYNYLYIDMELEKTTSSFTISGVDIYPATMDTIISNNGSIDFSTFNFSSVSGAIGTSNLDDVTYIRDSEVNPNTQANTTLSSSGYTFKFAGELYLSIRIIICPDGMFKCVKNSTIGPITTTTTYHTIDTINSQPSLKLQEGVYAYGGLLAAQSNVSYANWKLNNDAISATYYGTTGFTSERITSVNQVFRPAANLRGFKTTIVRGFTPNLNTIIYRTPTTYLFKMAGYESSGNIYTGINAATFGGIYILDNSYFHSIFNQVYGTKTWNFVASYGTYTITNKASLSATASTTTVDSFRLLISDRKDVNVVSTSLNVLADYYSLSYTDTSSLTVRRNSDIKAQNYNVNPAGYTTVSSDVFLTAQLRDTTRRNLIGNILDIHFTSGDYIPDMSLCHFSICPPYFKFSAIDPSGVTSIPFNSALRTPIDRYVAVDRTGNSYTPFSGHSTINNITFNKNSSKYYLEYFTDSDSNAKNLNVNNYKVAISLANGLVSDGTNDAYESFYSSTIIDNDDNAYVDLSLNSTELTIGINQQKLSLLSGFTIYDASYTEYNLQMKIGSIFISDPINTYDGTIDIILEFRAGDCTQITLYSVNSIVVDSANDNLDVTISRYSSTTGISNDFLTRSSRGLNIPWSTLETMKLSTPLLSSSELGTVTRSTGLFLNNLRTTYLSSLPSWVLQSPTSTLPRLAIIPTNLTGQRFIRQFLTTSKNVPKKTTILELQDHVRKVDNFGVPIHRITYGGGLEGYVLSLNSTVIRERVGSEPTTYLVDKINSGLPTTNSF